jgi:hypothetical protein
MKGPQWFDEFLERGTKTIHLREFKELLEEAGKREAKVREKARPRGKEFKAVVRMDDLLRETGIDDLVHKLTGGLEAFSVGNPPRLGVRWKSAAAHYVCCGLLVEMLSQGRLPEWKKAMKDYLGAAGPGR